MSNKNSKVDLPFFSSLDGFAGFKCVKCQKWLQIDDENNIIPMANSEELYQHLVDKIRNSGLIW